MSKSDTWMPLYIGDYLADTMALNAQEHGAYLLLIMHYWRTGPLPDDDRALAAIARVERKAWVSDVGPVVREFFTMIDGKLHQSRIDKERADAVHNSDKRRAAANTRWGKTKKQAECKTDANASAMHNECISPSPLPINPYSPLAGDKSEFDLEPPEPGRVEKARELDRDFAEFWAAYPRKEAKAKAQQAFAKARKTASHAEILAGVRGWPWDGKLTPTADFRPLAASWLNGRRWSDEGVTPPQATERDEKTEAGLEEYRSAFRIWEANDQLGPRPKLTDFVQVPA